MKRNVGMVWIWLVLLLSILTAGDAAAWWNDGWQYRKRISLNTTTNGADIKENLMDVPILIRLHSGNFDFSNAQAEGQDIRFVSSEFFDVFSKKGIFRKKKNLKNSLSN